ncbi:MAG: RNA polymerase sigma factor [Oscillospiraceae bacterium]|nr:RNA polymerase sigma factor [Oscillospiraceae bacterium]
MDAYVSEKDFENIVNQNKLIVYSTVLANLYYAAEVDDIVQETFIYAYYNFQTLRDVSKLTGWLCGIARNKSRTFNKKRGRTVYIDDVQSDVETSLVESVEEIVIENYNRAEITRGILTLSEKLRETVTLYYIGEKSTKEIAEILSIPEGTVRFRLAEARKKLKQELKELVNIMSTEKKEIADNELYAKVQENIDKAREYLYKQHLPQKASELCDETIEMISNFKPLEKGGEIEPYQLLYNLYYAKADSLIGVGRIPALDYYKKALEVVAQSGDLKWMAREYQNYATHLSNAKREKSLVLEYHKKAIDFAKQSGDEMIYVNNLASFANDMSEVRDSDRGLPQLEEVLKYKDKLLQNEQTYNTYFISHGLDNALSAVKEKGHLHDVDYLFSASIKAHKDGNIFQSYSFCTDYTPAKFSPIFKNIPDNICDGYKIEWESNSWFTYNTIKTTQEVVSMNEEITVSGEKFYNCIHIRETAVLNDDENDTSRGTELNKLLNGTTDIWYAPNVGIVKHDFAAINGSKFSIELSEYTINNKNEDETDLKKKYFPVALGNKWRYVSNGDTCRGLLGEHTPSPDEYEYDNLYETLFEESGNYYISYWCYAYKK